MPYLMQCDYNFIAKKALFTAYLITLSVAQSGLYKAEQFY
jgi:hypothetical protein